MKYSGNKLFKEFKGALTEQYVLQQLKTLKGLESYYWTNDRGSAEIDFVADHEGKEPFSRDVIKENFLSKYVEDWINYRSIF